MISLQELGLPLLPEKLPRPIIDSHTHLDATQEMSGLTPAVALDLAAQIGATAVVQVGCDAEDSTWAVACANRFENVVASVALHPNEVARYRERTAAGLATIEKLLAEGGEKVRAVGETGLDYFRTTDKAAQELQKDSFRAHIALAKTYDRTLVIHDRDAHQDIADLLDEEGWPARVVFHCFSADAAYAQRVLANGAWLSFPGTVTYKANEALREALDITPRHKILVETDAPYLTPIPARGKPNASYLLPHTVRFMAERLQRDLATLCDDLWNNAEAAFGGPWCQRKEK
ncbi:MAG: TatD family hydrolase [Propionibacteriaceae bacterium]